jgi:translation initiation factor IF-1
MNNIRINKKSIGDIVRVQVSGFDKSGKVILKYAE